MLRNILKLCSSYSLRHTTYSIKLSNIINNCKCSYSNYTGDKKDNLRRPLSEKNLTLVNCDDDWDAPEIKSVGDIVHHLRLSKYNRRHDVYFYIRLIKNAANEGDTEKMLSVFLHDMLIRDRVMPNRLFVNLLLSNLAKLGGHSEAAFRVLKRIKEIQLEPNMVTYSLVFKNCAREIAQHNLYFNLETKGVSLLSEEELETLQKPAKRAFNLWQKMSDRDEHFVLATTNSLLLTLNRAGMLKESCIVLDRFMMQGNRPDDYTLSAMLEGCLTDRVNGLGLALAFYNKLVNHASCRISPFVITTLLKVVEKCQFGSPSLIQNVLGSSSAEPQPFLGVYNVTSSSLPSPPPHHTNLSCNGIVPNSDAPYIHSTSFEYNTIIKATANRYGINLDQFIDSNWSPSNIMIYVLKSPTNMLQKRFVNHLDPKWYQRDLTPADKLMCIGGIFGVISIMKQLEVKPNIETLTSLVKCLPYRLTEHPDSATHDLFIEVLENVSKHLQLREDQAFRNAILKRKILLNIDVEQKALLATDLDPYSWSIQAKHCKNGEDFIAFLKVLSENKIVANKEMLFSAFTSVIGWGARVAVLETMIAKEIIPDRGMLVFMENEIYKMRCKVKGIKDDEMGRKTKEKFYKFQKRYASWIEKLHIVAVTTGKRTIDVDDLPEEYKMR